MSTEKPGPVHPPQREPDTDVEETSEEQTGQSGAQSGNAGMKQKPAAKGDGRPNPADVPPVHDDRSGER